MCLITDHLLIGLLVVDLQVCSACWLHHLCSVLLVWSLSCGVTSPWLEFFCRRQNRGVSLWEAGHEGPVQGHQHGAAGSAHGGRGKGVWIWKSIRWVDVQSVTCSITAYLHQQLTLNVNVSSFTFTPPCFPPLVSAALALQKLWIIPNSFSKFQSKPQLTNNVRAGRLCSAVLSVLITLQGSTGLCWDSFPSEGSIWLLTRSSLSASTAASGGCKDVSTARSQPNHQIYKRDKNWGFCWVLQQRLCSG